MIVIESYSFIQLVSTDLVFSRFVLFWSSGLLLSVVFFLLPVECGLFLSAVLLNCLVNSIYDSFLSHNRRHSC